ncbi:TraX family protein [Scardovia wiggsiae]|uniref:TraX family protein n=1 Tax=Scardovia wiggsiae TaxID=230143 RepID=UPI00374E55B0
MIWKIGTARFGYSATVLKWIALITMTADHIGFILFPQATALRVIGRIAMPVFAYLIAEGCRYSRHKLRYFLTVLGTGAVCSVAAYYAAGGTLYQNILITFALSIATICSLQYLIDSVGGGTLGSIRRGTTYRSTKGSRGHRQDSGSSTVEDSEASIGLSTENIQRGFEGNTAEDAPGSAMRLPVLLSAAWFLGMIAVDGVLGFPAPFLSRIGFSVDYGFMGILLPVFVYAVPNRRLWKWLALAAGICLLTAQMRWLEAYAFLSLPFVALYNGERGRYPMKYFFYLYYPAHIACITGISMLISQY